MSTSTFRFSRAALIVSALLWAAPALAATGGHLAYSAPEGCATQADFEASVAERGGHFDGEAAPGAGRELRVSIAQGSDGFRGSFQTVEAAGASTMRKVHGATCREVVAALAVVSAIALRGDDESQGAEATGAEAPAPVPAPAAAVAQPPASASKPAGPAESESDADEGRLRASSGIGGLRRVEVSAGTLRFDFARSLTLFAGGELGILPSTVLTRYDLSFNAADFVTTPDGKSYLSGVIPRIRLSYFGKGTYPASDAQVSVHGAGFALGLCWSPIYDTRGFVALFCAEYGLGVLQLESSGAFGPNPPGVAPSTWVRAKSPGFQTGGLSFEGEYHLGSFLHLALKLGVDAPLQTLTAERPDGSQIFQSSAFLGYGMLGVGFHF